MIWQDVVIALCQMAFIPAMIPSVVSKDKPALLTSSINAVLVSIITLSLLSLELWLSSATAAPVAMIWAILAVQKYKMEKIEAAK